MGARCAGTLGKTMKKTLLCVMLLSSILAGCVVVPVGRPWHRDYVVVDHDYHGDGWRR
jgi:hypothetical protein